MTLKHCEKLQTVYSLAAYLATSDSELVQVAASPRRHRVRLHGPHGTGENYEVDNNGQQSPDPEQYPDPEQFVEHQAMDERR